MKIEFPEGFVWGTAISAFQTEMGCSNDGNFGGTDWYEWANSPQIIKEGLVSGDRPQEGDGFWDTYREDLKLARSLGNNAFRMSIEWARIFPEPTIPVEGIFSRNKNGEPLSFTETAGTFSQLRSLANEEALNHYSQIVEYAHSLGLQVFMTLYHWPLPLWLHRPVNCHNDASSEKAKGWLNESTVEEFAKYALYISRTIGPRVEFWETINEPEVVATNGYIFGKDSGFPPGLADIPMGFRVERNLAFAHNLAFRILKKNTGRQTGIGTAPPYFEPVGKDPKDVEMANTARYLSNEWILNAAVNGEFDNGLGGVPDEKITGFGGADYVGIDYYLRMRVKYSEEDQYAGVLPLKTLPCDDCTDFQWDIYPDGMRNVTKWIYEKYGRPIYILENGIADSADGKRARYITDHLKALSLAISSDGTPIKGYFHWSLMDNFEWAKGYSMRFGLFSVDYKTKERVKRESASIYEKVCKGLPLP